MSPTPTHPEERFQSYLQTLWRRAQTGIWSVDYPGPENFWCSELCHLLDQPGPAPAECQEFFDLFHGSSRTQLIQSYQNCQDNGQAFEVEAQFHTQQGHPGWARVTGEAIQDENGRLLRLQGTVQNITDRMRLETEKLRHQRLESIGTLAGGMAHDINNLLTPIILACELLRDTTQQPEARSFLQIIQNNAERGAQLIRRLLGYARGAEGNRQRTNLAELLEELITLLRETFPRNIELATEVAPQLWTLVADPTQIHQVLMNLCVNARDAMPRGGRLLIALENLAVDEVFAGMNVDAVPGPYVVIRVEDNGCGMTPEIQQRLFEPFFTTKERGEGTGLGLPTAYAIIRGHGGFLHVYSEPAVGSRFKIYLPAQASADDVEEVAQLQTGLPRGQGQWVLLVDDEQDVRDIAQRALTRFGYRVLTASNGAEAVSLYVQHRQEIAVVLTDMSMPVMDGPATIVALRSINPQVRVIASSGLTTQSSTAQVASAGVRHFVAKPYNAETLLRKLHEVLQGEQEPLLAEALPLVQMTRQPVILLVEPQDSQLRLMRRALEDRAYEVLASLTAEQAMAAVQDHPRPIDCLVAAHELPGLSGTDLATLLLRQIPHLEVILTLSPDQCDPTPSGFHFLRQPYTPGNLLEALQHLFPDPQAFSPES